jgi:hypothetical protein
MAFALRKRSKEAVIDEFFGSRMQLLHQQGGNRFFNSNPEILVNLASSELSNEDMMETYLNSVDEVQVNQMMETWQSLPDGIQRTEFAMLDSKTQKLLLSKGYVVPSEEKKATPWYDYKIFGMSAPSVLKPVTGLVSWSVSSAAKGIMWPLEKAERFATHLGRTAYGAAFSEDKTDFVNNWKQAWHNSSDADASFHNEAVAEVRASLGDEETDRLLKFFAEGTDGVYQSFLDEGQSPEDARQSFYNFYQSLSDPDVDRAITTLSTNVNSLYLNTVRAYNNIPVLTNIEPESMAGKVLGVTGTLGTSILLDPFTYFGKVYKGVKGFRAQIVPGKGLESIEFMRRTLQRVLETDADLQANIIKSSRKAEDKAEMSLSNLVKDETWRKDFEELYETDGIIKRVLSSNAILPNILRRQLNGFIRVMNHVNDTFRYEDEIKKMASELFQASDGTVPESVFRSQAIEELTKKGKQGITFSQLVRDYPVLMPIVEHMRVHHDKISDSFIRITDVTNKVEHIPANVIASGTKTTGERVFMMADTQAARDFFGKEFKIGKVVDDVMPMEGLDTIDGYFHYMASGVGYESIISSGVMGTDPDLLLLPSAVGIGNVALRPAIKSMINGIVDFANKDSIDFANTAIREATGDFLKNRNIWIVEEIANDLDADTLSAAVQSFYKQIGEDKDVLLEILQSDANERILTLSSLGLDQTQTSKVLAELEDVYEKYESLAAAAVKTDGLSDDFFRMTEFDPATLRGTHKWNPQTKEWTPINTPLANVRRARLNYLAENLHPTGSNNDLLQTAWRNGFVRTKARFLQLAYTPAKFAQKMTTYMPTQPFIDVTDSATAIKEFTNLLDMGMLAHMPQSARDDYLQTFITGSEAQRWKVQLEFFTDFMGRSGALVHGGNDVQKFINRFIRHSQARYGQLSGTDVAPISGLTRHTGLIPGGVHTAGQMSNLNVIPNYRELGAVARYMNFYSRLGWGLHLPTIDKLISRTWRPAVLLRLGYVPRNGGEELFSWMLREGPLPAIRQRAGRKAAGFDVEYDEYGTKLLKRTEDIDDYVSKGIIYGATSRIWRSMNDLMRVGDKAITTQALKESIIKTGNKWDFLTPEQRKNIFDDVRDAIVVDKEKTILGMSRQLFNLSEKYYKDIMPDIQKTLRSLGMPTRTQMAQSFMKIDEDGAEDIRILRDLFNHPTVLDQHMKHILGSFDTYLDRSGTSLDSLIRNSSRNTGVDALVQLRLNYADTELSWVDNHGGANVHDKTIAAHQRLRMMSGDGGHIAMGREWSHYLSPTVQKDLQGRLLFTQVTDFLTDTRQSIANSSDLQAAVVDLKNKFYKMQVTLDEGSQTFVIWDDVVDSHADVLRKGFGVYGDSLVALLKSDSKTDINTLSFLLNALADPAFDVGRISSDWLQIKERGRKAMANYYRTPEGQQSLHSLLRSELGGWAPGTGPVQLPVPPGKVRVWIPMIAADRTEALKNKFNTVNTLDSEISLIEENFAELETLLVGELEALGHTDAALKAAQLIKPLDGDTAYPAVAASWSSDGHGQFPLLLMSSDPNVAEGVARAVDTWLGGNGSSYISSKLISDSDLLSKQAKIDLAQGRSAGALSFGESRFWGISDLGERIEARDFVDGLGSQSIWATSMHEVSTGSGLTIAPMSGKRPALHENIVYKHKDTGRVVIHRVGQGPPNFNIADYDEALRFTTSGNDLHNVAEEVSAMNIVEAEHMLTSGSRSPEVEAFGPWIEAVRTDGVATDSLMELTTRGNWWDKAPQRLLAYTPVVNEGGTVLEKMDKAWNTVLRNWFDGVVNPMIGAMVREPLFHHYFVKSYKQTTDVRRLHHHSPMAYKTLRDKRSKLNKQGFILFEDDQIRILGADEFIRYEWPLAKAEFDSPLGKLVWALEEKNVDNFRYQLEELIKSKTVDSGSDFGRLIKTLQTSGDGVLNDFIGWANNRKLQFDRHRDVATQRAMRVTSNFIDDHRIRSQFQGMVGTALPFWFAEDQFLRRVGRSLKHNPLMFRNANLWMMAGVEGGIIQEDQFGNQRLVIPGSGMAVRAGLEIVDRFPIVNKLFGGDLAAVVEGDLTTNINVIPGYNFNRTEEDPEFLKGEMGFGPLLAVPLLWASQTDPSIRAQSEGFMNMGGGFKNNLIGGRFVDYGFNDDPQSGFNPSLAAKQMIGAVIPALVTRTWENTENYANIVGLLDDPSSRTKAATDIIMLRFMEGTIPSEEELSKNPNREIEMERFFDEINAEATQLQMLQTMTWFFGPGSATFSDLVLKNERWEWNEEFYTLLDTGLPYEEALKLYRERVIAKEGEFNPYMHSPFTSKSTSKVPLSALDATQESNVWITENRDFVQTYNYGGSFFMPRKFDVDDDKYSSEARDRQVLYGLREYNTPEEFLDHMYYSTAATVYFDMKEQYQTIRYAMRARGSDTSNIVARWNNWSQNFMSNHPVFERELSTGESKRKRELTINQFRIFVNNPDIVPDTYNREDILNTMGYIVSFKDELDALRNIPNSTELRNSIKLKYYRVISALTEEKPWLNEMYYSVFMPIIGDSWVAKLQAGLLEFDRGN